MSKKMLVISSVLLLACLLLAACGTQTETPAAADVEMAVDTGAVEPATEIVIYNWAEYLDPEIYTMFEDQYGIKVVEDTFSNNEELLAKLQGGAGGYSLIVPSDYTVSIMVEENMLAELDHANIPNIANLSEGFKSPPYDPELKYCIPYQWGTTGIGYVDGEVEEPTSWSVFFNPDPSAAYYGRMTMLDDVRESFAAALVYLGYDINTTVEAQLQEAKDLLIKAKPALSGYDADTFEDLLASGENLIAHGWNGDFLMAQEDNENVAYTIPEEGGVLWTDNICIPVTVSPEQKLAAEMFINYLLQADIGAMLSEYTWFASPNAAAEDVMDEELLSDPTVYPPAEVLDRLQFIEPVGEAESLYQRLWDEVKSASVQ